jgi:hypothetical protein
MRKRVATIGAVGGIGFLLAYWLGASLGLPGLERGRPQGDRARTQPAASTTPVNASQPSSGVVTVRINGDQFFVNNEAKTAAEIAAAAADRVDPATGNPAPAQVIILRSADATARAREELVKALNGRQVLHAVK